MVKMERGSGVTEPPPSGVHPIHRAYTLLKPTSFSALHPILYSASSPSPSALRQPSVCVTYVYYDPNLNSCYEEIQNSLRDRCSLALQTLYPKSGERVGCN